MNHFVDLYQRLDSTTKTNALIDELDRFFSKVPSGEIEPEEAIWVLALLTGNRPKVAVKRGLMRQWVLELASIPEWLFQESYGAVGDLSETISLLIPNVSEKYENQRLDWWMKWLSEFKSLDESEQRERMLWAWSVLSPGERFILCKLVGGSFRVGVSKELTIRALARSAQLDVNILTDRMMGDWTPDRESWHRLTQPEPEDRHSARPISQPYPLCLAHSIPDDLLSLGSVKEFQFEYKWDGIRAQIIKREDRVFLWSRGDEEISAAFPDLVEWGSHLQNGTVLDGEIVIRHSEKIQPFSDLQKRFGRQSPSKKLLAELPANFIAYDLLEVEGEDQRENSLADRRAKLDALAELHRIDVSQKLSIEDWDQAQIVRSEASQVGAEGLMVKYLDSKYLSGRKRGAWWKWKIEPLVADLVLIYAQKGTGRRANLYTDYTFGAWKDGQLVPVAKAYSGLTDLEIANLDRIIKSHVLEKFGPVRTVKPTEVFEVAFEGIQESSRHKSGIAVRFPRISRWRTDKSIEEADTVESLRELIRQRYSSSTASLEQAAVEDIQN